MKIFKAVVMAVAVGLMFTTPSYAALTNIIDNGDFDAGPGPPWVESSNYEWPLITSSGLPSSITPHSGNYVAWLGGIEYGEDTLYQDIAVPDGTAYLTVQLYLSVLTDELPVPLDVATLMVNGYTVYSWDNRQSYPAGWTGYAVNVPGDLLSSTIRLSLDSSNDDNRVTSFFFDTISVYATPVPIPPAVYLMGSGLVGLVGIRRRMRKQ